ncbi:OLC1v1011321C1 [Oldenlandia corymbosa var. corymbosa]|uniref:OLC1v1011321C1 n=1 Tax=Oldenlandia corymbosa var. corymbosa TaxID=529605 RepID=A0AAV1DU07_OLDCO|nr:OLC1v1011321C1 [Oldenlandia corymbosa var. corymbosa]
MKLLKLRSKKFLRSNSSNKIENNNKCTSPTSSVCGGEQIKWEMRPGGMLVQKRVCEDSGSSCTASSDGGDGVITVRVSTFSNCHNTVSIQSTSTFGELKLMLSLVTNLEPKEQRLLFKGKERDDNEYLHMVGVRDNDKVLLLEDPAVKERKLRMGLAGAGVGAREVIMGSPYRTISV